MMIRPLLAVCLITLPSAANADWQYTKWGMTQAQVVAASKGTVEIRKVKNNEGVETNAVGGIYAAGGRTYKIGFGFEGGKLNLVGLTLADANNCRHLLADLKSLYGDPIEESGGMFPQWLWDDRKKGNRISATGITLTGECLLQYQPLPTAKDTGL